MNPLKRHRTFLEVLSIFRLTVLAVAGIHLDQAVQFDFPVCACFEYWLVELVGCIREERSLQPLSVGARAIHFRSLNSSYQLQGQKFAHQTDIQKLGGVPCRQMSPSLNRKKLQNQLLPELCLFTSACTIERQSHIDFDRFCRYAELYNLQECTDRS